MTNKIKMIAAVAENGVIGGNNGLLWNIPEDLRWFRAYTLNTNVVMGRKTMDSLVALIGGPLPNRNNFVLSRSPVNVPGFERIGFQDVLGRSDIEDFMIIGGGEIYKQFLPHCDTMYITHVHKAFDGDTFFPQISKDDWRREWKDGPRGKDLNYTFDRYIRKERHEVN